MKKIISTPNAPVAAGPYSTATEAGGMIFISGQLPIDPATNQLVANEIGAQTERAIRNIQIVLESVGLSLEHVVKTTLFLRDAADWPLANGMYAKFFMPHPPARSMVVVSSLPRDARIEIEAIAVR